MLSVAKVAELHLAHGAGASGSTSVAAASGLAILDGTVYVIADDEAYLAIFTDMAQSPGTTAPFLDVEVPSDATERKKHKPDLESLTPLDAFGPFAHGGLIALGSGSKKDRHHGAFAIFEADGSVRSTIQLDSARLMEELNRRIPGLNLEGTAVAGRSLRVFQRGNDSGSYNAHIDLDLDGLQTAIESDRILKGDLITAIQKHDLGQLRGTRLCFSDADTIADGRVVFSASAEAEREGVDGEVAGSAIGVMGADGEVLSLEPIDVDTKVEGLAAVIEGAEIHAYMVSDEDDPDKPSALLRTTFKAPPS